MSHPKDTGKGGLTKLPKFRTQSRPQWESNPAGKNVRSPFIQSQRSTHSATAADQNAVAMQISIRSFHFGAEDTGDAISVKIPEVGVIVVGPSLALKIPSLAPKGRSYK